MKDLMINYCRFWNRKLKKRQFDFQNLLSTPLEVKEKKYFVSTAELLRIEFLIKNI